MVHTDKPSLSLCAFGAGAAHVAMLALVLPVMITLPAPEDRARGTIAIQVVVRSAPPPFIAAAMAHPGIIPETEIIGEGDADEAAWIVPADAEVTGALPDMPERALVREEAPLIEEAALSDPVAPAPPADAVAAVAAPSGALLQGAPVPALEENVTLDTVASIEGELAEEPDFMPAVVPRPARKPKFVVVQRPKVEPAPEPRPRVAAPVQTRPAAAVQPKPKPFKGFLGGTRAVPMAEFPFRAGR